MARHDFKLTELGARLAERKAEGQVQLWSKIQKAAEVIMKAGDLDYMELSIAAKAYYVLNKLNGKATMEDIAGMLPKFGWSVSAEQLRKATDFFTKTDLVRKGQTAADGARSGVA